MPLQKIFFTKGIDSDTSPEEFQEGFGRYRVDVRVMNSNDGETQSAENVKGNVFVAHTLPTGVNTVIGSTEYQLDKKNYYFVYNTLGNHSILEYDQVTNAIAVVFQSPILNLKLTALITGINVIRIDVGKTLLYWTDGWIDPANPDNFNEPKKINIEKGKAFMAGNYVTGYKAPFDADILYRIKKPPTKAPFYSWSGLPEAEFKAANRTTQFGVNAGDPPVIVIFDNDYFNPTHQYNPANGVWTVGVTGTYNITAQVNASVPLPSGQLTRLYVEIYVNNIFKQRAASNIGDTFYYFTTINASLALNSMDNVTIQTYISPNGTGVAKGISFSAYKAQTSSLAINHLFKKLYQFKVQFKYDDYEISAWSPICNYEFPATTAGTTGEDIVLQDNKIELTVPTGGQIVTAVRIAAKEIASTDFTLIVELNKADLGILDNSFYTYEFTNETNGVPLEVNESIKLSDNVPLTSQTQELIKGIRLVDANITENFNPVSIDLKMGITYAPVELGVSTNGYYPNVSYLKDGGLYDIGIVYYDHANRSGLTNIIKGKSTVLLPNGKYGTQLYVPFLTEDTYNPAMPNGDMSYVPFVNTEIYNPPPVWATHYQIVRSKNLIMGRYIQFTAQKITYTDDLGNIVSSTSATQVIINVGNITGIYKTENPNSQLVYDYVAGDRIRFIAQQLGSTTSYNQVHPFFPFNDTEIVAWDPINQNIRIYINGNNILRGLLTGVLFEIYNALPQVVSGSELVYEMDECYDILTLANGDRVHGGKTSDQAYCQFSNDLYVSGNVGFITVGLSGFNIGDKIKAVSPVANNNNTYGVITNIQASGGNQIITTDIRFAQTSTVNAGTLIKAAQTTLRGGDTFRRFCNMPWVVSGTTYRLYSYIDNMNVSNFFTSPAYNVGRPNRIDPNIIRVARPATITYSNKLIPETFINGLSSTSDNNFESYELPYGGIYNLDASDQRLIMYQELKISAIPIEQGIVNTTQGESVVGQSTDVLSPTAIYYASDLGIGRHPESFSRREQATYGIDVKRGVVWRLSTDGVTPISEYFQHVFFTELCRKIMLSSTKVNIYGVYDIKFGEYVISISSFTYNGQTEPAHTIAFNEKFNMWSTYYNYVPEGLVGCGVDIISFKNGGLWKHNANTLYSNWYGVQYNPELHFYCNLSPSNIKVFQAISLESDNAWDCIVETPVTLQNPNGQHTELISSNFKMKEGLLYSQILKDDYTPNTVVGAPYLPNARFVGRPIRGKYALVKLKYKGVGYTKIFAANVLVIGSDRSNK